ncbi:hypothetical protein IBX35_01425 [Candidatus Bathyarchaeota archaeon]|nr:hypothetical protein [Candidatus Bathyarchaeota archaeon]
MSEEGGFGLVVAEKFFGLILIVVGALSTYYTFTSTQALRDYTAFFGFLSVIVLALGVILVIAKIE